MKIRITGKGIYGAGGKQLELGTVLDIKGEPPAGWKGKYVVENAKKAEAEPATNPKKDDSPSAGHPKAPETKK